MNTETIKLNRGMNNNGGAFFCQNIRPPLMDGVFAGVSLTNKAKRTASTPTYLLERMVGFTKYGSGFGNIFGKDTAGNIYIMGFAGANATMAMDYSLTAGFSRGIMVDSNNNLVYTGSQYIGRMYPTTLDGNLTIDASACDVVDASEFPTAGYAIISSVSGFEVIQWTGKSTNQLTGVTRGKYNTTAIAHSSGDYIYYFKDNWIDMGASLTTSTRQCIRWEDENFFVNGNVVSGYKEADGSDFATKISLSSDKTIVDLGLLQTSATSYVLIGANSGENGYIYVWDGKDTQAISEKELKNNNITRIWNNFIATDSGIYRYDGTNLEILIELMDKEGFIIGGGINVYDMKTVGEYLLYTVVTDVSNDRDKAGLYFLNIRNGDRYFVIPSNYHYGDTIFGAMFPIDNTVLVGTNYSSGAIDAISQFPKSRGSTYQVVYNPTNSRLLQLKKLRINVNLDTISYNNVADPNFDIIIRGYDFTRPFIKTAQLKSGETPTGANQFIITSDLGVPSVGDRVEIIDRLSSSCDSSVAYRNITSVLAGTSKYTITVDEDFPDAIGTTEQNTGATVLFHPLKELGRISIDSSSINLQGYTIPLLDQPRFKKMLFEIEIRCGNTTIAPELNSLEINYEVLE